MLALLCTLLLTAAPARADARGTEAARRLEQLGAPTAAERAAAERWLAEHLALDDFPDLHAAARTAGAEARRRLVVVLASSDRHFELAVQLGLDERYDVAELGREALLELATSWTPECEELGDDGDAVEEALRRLGTPRFALEPEGLGRDAGFELLALAGGVPLVLDPDLVRSPAPVRRDPDLPARLEGDAAELLVAWTRAHALALDGFGLDDGGDLAFVRVTRRLRAGDRSARDLLVDWSLRVAAAADADDARNCARALARSGWPAATAWLERRWFERGDEAALAGLRALASRGLVAPRLATVEVQDAWLARAAAAPEETARALGALVPRGSGREDLEAGLLAGWESLGARERWVRLVALELRGRGSDSARARALETLRAPAASVGLAHQALRTAAELGARDTTPLPRERLAALLRRALPLDGGRELVRCALRIGLPVPAEATREAASARERLALCEWALLSGEEELARDALRDLVVAGELARELRETPAASELVARARSWRRLGGGPALGRVLGDAPELRTLAVLVGVASEDVASELEEQLYTRARAGEAAPAELQVLAARAAGPRSGEILGLLAERAARDGCAGVLPAIEEALRALRAERRDAALESFLQRVRRLDCPAAALAPRPPAATPLRGFERAFEP